MLNLIELDHRQTTPKISNYPGKQEEATGINGESTRTLQLQDQKWKKQRTILTQQRTHDVCKNSKIQQKQRTELKNTKFQKKSETNCFLQSLKTD